MLVRVTFESKGDFSNVNSWLSEVGNRSPDNVLKEIGEEGVRSLSTNTPKDTGETVSGWDFDITTYKTLSEISWTNHAHPESDANVAKLIELGHGTGTGGYVSPRPYITKSMDGIFSKAGDKVVKELIK